MKRPALDAWLHIRVSRALKDQLTRHAKASMTQLATVIRQAITAYLKRKP
jgi:predicted transcriptional regulator